MGMTVARLIAPLADAAALPGGVVVHQIDEEQATVKLTRSRDGEDLVVRLRPRDDGRPCYAATASLSITYVGQPGTQLAPDFAGALQALVAIVRHNDRGEPLEAGVGHGLSAPESFEREGVSVSGGVALIRIRSTCEMDCIFCTRGRGGSLPKPRPLSGAAEVERYIDEALAQGARVIRFGGDEPLTHPEVEAFIRRAREGGAGVHLATSGLQLAERRRAEHLMHQGVTHVDLPIYGPSAEVHDAITERPGSFTALLGTLRALAGIGLSFSLHSVLMRQNLAHVDELRRFVRSEFGLHNLGFAHLMPRNDSVDDYVTRMPSYAETTRALSTDASLLGFPLCAWRTSRTIDTSGAAKERVKPPAVCDRCRLAPSCPGTFRVHLRAYGLSELAPLE